MNIMLCPPRGDPRAPPPPTLMACGLVVNPGNGTVRGQTCVAKCYQQPLAPEQTYDRPVIAFFEGKAYPIIQYGPDDKETLISGDPQNLSLPRITIKTVCRLNIGISM